MIAAERERRGLSQRKVAKLAGISPTHMREIETGTRNPGAAVMNSVAAVLHLDPARLRKIAARRKLAELKAQIAELREVAR